MNWLATLFRYTLNSVPFGIALMVLIASYIAFGSGFAGLREYWEMDEILFFNAWPLKLLMVLLVLNIAVVTVVRIPLTAPRLGVWTIHMGIILLVMSTAAYYSRKVEGMIKIPVNQSADYFYDRWERALYARVQGPMFMRPMPLALPDLPRFNEYSAANGRANYLNRSSLRDLNLTVNGLSPDKTRPMAVELGEAIGLGQPLKMDIVGYWPYAEVLDQWKTDQPTGQVGIRLEAAGAAENDVVPAYLLGSENDAASAFFHTDTDSIIEVRHLPMNSAESIEAVVASLKKMHQITVTAAGKEHALDVQPGESYVIDGTDYTIKPLVFLSAWPTMDSDRKRVPAMVFEVLRGGSNPARFLRVCLVDRERPTDFIPDPSKPTEMGERLRDRLFDDQLKLSYKFSDINGLFPGQASSKWLIVTRADSVETTRIRIEGARPLLVEQSPDGAATFVADIGKPPIMSGPGEMPRVGLRLGRVSGLVRAQEVRVVPSDLRNRSEAAAGLHQVIELQLSAGDWKRQLFVEFRQFEDLHPPGSAMVQVPGAAVPFQLTLGTTRRPMPVQVKLDGFEATPYLGVEATASAVMRDFRSDLSITDRTTGNTFKSSASLNQPAFVKQALPGLIPDESWILYQAQWDPNGQRFTVLGVANRPAVRMMALACCLIVAGLLYAFYVKPYLIRRRKQRAIAQAKASGKLKVTSHAQALTQ
jgi:hypothetical protein